MVVLTRLRRSCFALLVALLAGGCAAPRTGESSMNPDELSDVEFQAYLAEVPLISVAESFRAMLILADGADATKSFDERRTALESRGIVRSEWNLQPGNVLDRGTLAYMVLRICQIRGGVNMVLFGSWGLGDRRYALRELVYRDMITDGADYEFVRGGEMVAVMTKADKYMQQHGLYAAPEMQFPDEPPPGQTPEWAVPTTGASAAPEASAPESTPPAAPTEPAPPPTAPDAGTGEIETITPE